MASYQLAAPLQDLQKEGEIAFGHFILAAVSAQPLHATCINWFLVFTVPASIPIFFGNTYTLQWVVYGLSVITRDITLYCTDNISSLVM
jgi:hypothetical protein